MRDADHLLQTGSTNGGLGTTSVQFNRRNGKLGLELSNATASICEIFALLFCEAHNPKVVSSNLTPATNYLNPRPGIRRPAFSFVAGSSPKSRAVIFLCAPQTTRDAGRRSPSGSNLTPAANFLFVYKGFLNSNRKPFLLWAR